jgi:hypothetical protein
MIQATYRSVDGYSKQATFKTVGGLRRFINKWAGLESLETAGPQRAVSWDGIGVVRWSGATVWQVLEGVEIMHLQEPGTGEAELLRFYPKAVRVGDVPGEWKIPGGRAVVSFRRVTIIRN